MNTLLIVLITLVSIALIILIVYTVVFLVGLIKTMKQVRIAAAKVQEGADSAAELVEDVRRTVVNPGIIAMMIEKYLSRGHHKSKGKKDE